MSAVFGFSVGAGSVRIIRIVKESRGIGKTSKRIVGEETHFLSRSLPVAGSSAQRVSSDAAVDLEKVAGVPLVIASPERFSASVEAELRSAGLSTFRLVSEAESVLEFVSASGAVRGFCNLLVYDLGKTGLTVSIVDVATGRLQSSLRTRAISGDYFDQLVVEQVRGKTGSGPKDAHDDGSWTEYGRAVKEALSNALEYRESESDSVVMSRFDFESIVRDPILGAMSVINQVSLQAERRPDVVVVVGGGARIPLLEVLLSELGIPVIRPAEPEFVVGKGAALWARIREAPTRAMPIVRISATTLAPAWTGLSDDETVVMPVGALTKPAVAEVLTPDLGNSESGGSRSRIPVVLGIVMTIVAILSLVAWAVLQPFEAESMAVPLPVATESIVVISTSPIATDL